jgi:hypothetical protein
LSIDMKYMLRGWSVGGINRSTRTAAVCAKPSTRAVCNSRGDHAAVGMADENFAVALSGKAR